MAIFAEWVKVFDNGARLRCERCGAVDAIRLPVELRAWLDQAKGFARLHSQCKPVAQAAAAADTGGKCAD